MKQSWLRQFGFHVRRLLQEFDFVKDLEPSVADRVADTVHRASGQSGDVCFREGDSPEYLYIVIAGYVLVWKDIILEDEDDAPQVRYDEGSIEAQMQCTMMESMLKEREAERAAQLETEMAKAAKEQRSALKKRRYGSQRRPTTDPDLHEFGEGRESMGPNSLTLPVAGSHSPLTESPSPTRPGSSGSRPGSSHRSSMRGRRRSVVGNDEDEEEDLLQSGRHSRLLSIGDMEMLPGFSHSRQSRFMAVSDSEALQPPRHRLSVQFPEPDEEGRSPSAPSGRRSIRHGSTFDASNRGSFSSELEAGRSTLKTPDGAPKGRRECRLSRTVDEALAADEPGGQAQAASTGTGITLAAAASRRPGADEVFGVHIATLGPGSIFGETALIEDSPRSASVTCKGPCQFLVIGREDFERVLKSEIKKLKLQKLAGPVRHLLSSFQFYQELDDHVQKAVVDIVRYSSHPAGTVFFRQGDPPGSCYIVLSGTVSVWKNDIVEEEEEKKEEGEAVPTFAGSPMGVATAGALSKAMSAGVRTVTGQSNNRASMLAASAISKAIVAKLSSTSYGSVSVGAHVVAEALSIPEDWGVQVAVLSPGTLFGEVSLLENAPRNATAVAAEDCELFSIQRAPFDAVLRSAMNTDHSVIPKHAEAIVHHLPTFNNMRTVVRQNIPHIMRQHHESEGSVIWFSGDVLSRCYLLLSGEVTFWEETVLGDPFAPVTVEMGNEEVRASCAELAALLSQAAEPTDLSPTASSRPSSGGPEEQVTQYTKSQGLYGFRSRVVQAGVLFGADSLFDGKPVTNTVTCQKDCLFLVINKTDFDDVLREEIRMEKMRKAASQVRRVLMEFPIFRDLAQGVIDALPSVVTYRTEKAGCVLFNQGEPPSDCYIVLAGEVMARKLDGCDGDPSNDDRQDVAVPETPARRTPKRGAAQTLEPPKASKNQPSVRRSPPISLAVRDMCGALSMMLALVDNNAEESDGLSDDEGPAARKKRTLGGQGGRRGGLDDKGSWALGTPVAALGPGSLVGELALIADKPRSATVTCEEDSEFLVIGKDAFDRLVKREMKRSRDAKLEFLRKHVPHFKTLKDNAAEASLYFFKHGTYPRNHRFFTKGEPADGSIHIVWKGGVEVTAAAPRPSSRPTSRASSRGGGGVATPERRIGMLLRGSCFGSLPAKQAMPFTAVSSTSVCEVISLSAENLGLLPEVVQRGLREQADQVMARRSAGLETASGTGRAATKGAAALQARRTLGNDEAMLGGTSQAEAWTLPRVSSCPSKLCSREPNADLPYPFNGLFKGEPPALDFREFDMMPGECLAMTGKMPMKRSKRLEASMKQLSTSSSNSAMALSAAQAVPSGGSSSVLEILSPWAARPASRSGSSSRMPSRGHLGFSL